MIHLQIPKDLREKAYSVSGKGGEVRTPFFIAVKMAGDGSHEIVYSHLGGLTDARAFLDLMIEAYGIKHEDLLIKEAASSPNESPSKR